MNTDASDSGSTNHRVVSAGGSAFHVTSTVSRSSYFLAAATAAAVMGAVAVIMQALLFDDSDVPPAERRERAASQTDPLDSAWFAWTLGVLALVTLVGLVSWLITRRQYMKNQNEGFAAQLKAQEEYHQQALEKLRKTTELATLMELNQGQIGEYHRIVTDQADKAFKSSRTAMGVGLFLLVCAAFGGVYVPLEEIRWFIAALAAFSTLLSGYLSRTYMILYRESISQLNRYFDQPVLNSYYLTAERLTQSLDREHVVEIRRQIISEVLATSSRLGAKSADATLTASSAKPKKKLKKQAAKKRVPKQAAPSQNSQAN
ncbi:hypothetical protein [Streptomyces sp. NPDC046862]|uniref:hypothetical protein n=1 Tax=Streptomyces sp. NPDC046862 TaxID=3154603 RepID=UPI003451A7F5